MKTQTKKRNKFPPPGMPANQSARQRVPDARPFVITGRDSAGKVIAFDRACDNGKASQVAESWRGICAAVEIHDAAVETAKLKAVDSAGAGGRPEASAAVLGQLGASI